MSKEAVRIEVHNDVTTLILDGKDISQRVSEIVFSAGAHNRTPQITILYNCYDQGVLFEGEAEVEHVCPKKAR